VVTGTRCSERFDSFKLKRLLILLDLYPPTRRLQSANLAIAKFLLLTLLLTAVFLQGKTFSVTNRGWSIGSQMPGDSRYEGDR